MEFQREVDERADNDDHDSDESDIVNAFINWSELRLLVLFGFHFNIVKHSNAYLLNDVEQTKVNDAHGNKLDYI